MKTLARLVLLAAAVTPLLAADEENSCREDQWQCKTGGKCIWKEEHCNGKLDCPDSSDESADCTNEVGNCILPPLPEFGTYQTDFQGEPGDSAPYFTLNVTCNVGYKVIGDKSVECLRGWWRQLIPSCAYAGECGVIPANITEQTGISRRSQMPWHVDFYDKVLNYQHICAGSLIRDDAVITLAFCFLNIYPKLMPIPAEETVAVAGNRHQAWNSPDESPFLQKSGVKEIYLANYNTSANEEVNLDDLAIVILTDPFKYNTYIRPVCINFDVNFDRLQLQPGSKGKFPAWGFSANEVQEFKPNFDVIDFSLVDSDKCILSTRDLLKKNNFVLKPEQTICTEYNQSVLYQCLKGYDDTGSGLVYPQPEPGGTRYYLRGVLWRFGNFVVSPNVCTQLEGYGLFTRIQNYEAFVKKYFKQPTSVVDDKIQSSKCTYPPYPTNGKYIPSKPKARPGYSFEEDVSLNVICTDGYVVNVADPVVRCSSGVWTPDMPQCVPKCRLKPHPSVHYKCVVKSNNIDGIRECNEYEPSGTRVKVECQTNYYPATTLKDMFCNDGEWSSDQKCSPECGILTPNATELVLGGNEAQNISEVPWHAGIYNKKISRPYMYLCGGSIISNSIVISAAHCFWHKDLDKPEPAEDYAVAVGKLFRRWDSPKDILAQRFSVKELHLPQEFHGNVGHLQSDIAIVMLDGKIEYKPYIRPVCLDFDERFEKRQLSTGNKGKVAGWGYVSEEEEKGATVLQVIDLPFVDYITCYEGTPMTFRPHLTPDKICAGYRNAGKALCQGDSGGGLAFLEENKETARYYLRGLVSEAPPTDNKACNANTYTTFTHLTKFKDFIKRYWYD